MTLLGKDMNPIIPLVVSILALVVSGITAWLTLLRRGRLRMTQPATIFLGEDGGGLPGKRAPMKVYLRTLLFSTARRGQTVESLHLNVQRGDTKQNFSIWVYGEEKLSRGSGLHVGFQGVVCNHHFLLPKDGSDFRFLAGDYIIRVFAKLVERKSPEQLAEVQLHISEQQAHELVQPMTGIYFDWSPDQQRYHSHIEGRK
jgi:hypothetical protein